MQKHAYLDTLHLLYEASQKLQTQSYIWGGLTLDIWEGRFLRKHHDIDVLTTHLYSLLPAFEEVFGEAGYETRILGNGDLKVVNPDVNLHLGHVNCVDGLVEWTHNGTNGSLVFPQHWLNSRPYQFYTCSVMTVTPEFEYVLKMHPERMNPAWIPREKDLTARDVLTSLLAEHGITTDGLSRHMQEVFPKERF